MLHQTATFGETTGRRSATKRHKIHKRICIFCAFLWLISLPDGDDRVRTDGLRSASAALSQLSYIPSTTDPLQLYCDVGLGRVELPTSRLSGVRSNHLSYRPDGVPEKFKKKYLRQKAYRRKNLRILGRVSAIQT